MVKIDSKKAVFLIDGSSFLYRAYYGSRPLHTPQGAPVQAVYSFCRMIKKMVDKHGIEYIALVWDSKGKTTRHEVFPEYKANRQAPPSDIFDQKDLILEFADIVGLKNVARQGIEADDLMFSLARDIVKEGKKAVFVTSDKDMGQALDESIVLFDAFKDVFVDVPSFEQKMGFEVKKLPFYFSLLGDSSDNIPGVRGIGKKGAAELVKNFDSLEDLYSRLDDVEKKRMRTCLQENKHNAFLSRQLFLLQYHVMNISSDELYFEKNNFSKARDFFIRLNFKSLLKEITKDSGVTLHAPDTLEDVRKYTFKSITTKDELELVCELVRECGACAVDTETDGLVPLDCNLIGISICVQDGIAYYIPVGHKTGEQQLSRDFVIDSLRPIFESDQYKKYFHNAKFDQLVLYVNGITVKGMDFDTFLAAKLVLREWQSAGLKKLSEHYFNERMLSFKEVVKDNKYADFSYVPLELAVPYAAADAHQTLKLVKVLKQELSDKNMIDRYRKIDIPLSQILFKMEAEGVYFDLDKIKVLNERLHQELVTVDAHICSLIGSIGGSINLNSPQQIEHLLFGSLGLPPQKKRAKGRGYSTDREVLSKLSKIHPVPGLILKYREFFKLKSTYVDALPECINKKTGKIHTTFSQTSTATGRLSSFDPNLQNIPADSQGYGIEIRAAFRASQNSVFLSADYSQIELRVMAHLAQEESLLDAFLNNRDIHAETAARLFDVHLQEVDTTQRQIGKRINFSILYGLTPYGLSRELNISLVQAKHYIEKYFSQYPKVAIWMEKVVESVKTAGFIETLWGKRRFIPAIYEKNRSLYEEARRIAINTRVQGTAAEIMELGMINVDRLLEQGGLKSKIVLQIHDELILSVPCQEFDRVSLLVKETLEKVVDWRVPLVANLKSGSDWKEVTK